MLARQPTPLWVTYGSFATMFLALGSAVLLGAVLSSSVVGSSYLCVVWLAAYALHAPAWFLLFGLAMHAPAGRPRTLMRVAFVVSLIAFVVGLFGLGKAYPPGTWGWFGAGIFAPVLPPVWVGPVVAHSVMFISAARFCGYDPSRRMLLGSAFLLAVSLIGLVTLSGIVDLGGAVLLLAGLTSPGYFVVFGGFLAERQRVVLAARPPLSSDLTSHGTPIGREGEGGF